MCSLALVQQTQPVHDPFCSGMCDWTDCDTSSENSTHSLSVNTHFQLMELISNEVIWQNNYSTTVYSGKFSQGEKFAFFAPCEKTKLRTANF